MKNLITIIILTFTLWMNAQKITINGTIKSVSNKESLSAVVVSFYNAKTDKLITYAYSDFDGNYKVILQKIPFYIQAKILGYNNYQSKIYNLSVSKTVNILMNENTTELDEVVLFQKKKLITLRGDKMIVDIENSGFGDGNNGIETLSKLPGMRLNKDDNLVFRGGNLQILINGKPSLLSGDALQQYLKTLNGNTIKSVEIISNPSAKYDASGSGGILNIKLKKAVNIGLTGNVYTSVGYAEYIKQLNGINLYNNTKKWNINAGLYYSYFEGVNHRDVTQTAENVILKQKNDWLPVSNVLTSKFGVAYAVSKNATLGTSLRYSNDNSNENTTGKTDEFYNTEYLKYTLLNSNLKSNESTFTGNMYYSFATDSLTTKIDSQLNFAKYIKKENRLTSNKYLTVADDLPYKNTTTIQNNNPKIFNILTVKFDIEHKLKNNISIETGTKFSYVNNDYNLIRKDKNTQGEFVLDALRSNHLIYDETIFSLYGIANYNSEKWSFKAGLRSEYIDYKAHSKTNNTTNAGNDLSFFPSFNVNRSFDNNQYRFSYSKRIQRPRYLDLNPFYQYIDTYNVEVGNPHLDPQFTNAFELNWVHKRKTSLALFARFTKDEITDVFDYNKTTQITTIYKDNIAKSENIGLSLTTSIDVTKWWSLYFSSDYYYNHVESNTTYYKYDLADFYWSASVNQTIKIKNDWKLTWNSYYSSGGTYGSMIFQPSYDMSFGLKTSCLKKKLLVNLKANNVLKKSMWHSVSNQNNVKTEWINRSEMRKFSLSLTYNFGQGKKEKIKRTDLQDEQNRL